jgi:hypothetical protein
MVVPEGFDQMTTIHQLMTDFAQCPGLEINHPTTIVVPHPLSEGDPETHMQRLVATALGWAAFSLRHVAKYVDFLLGPGRGREAHAGPMKKFRDRFNAWGCADGGSFLNLAACNVYILPVVAFVAQLEDLPRTWDDEARAVKKLLPGPWNWPRGSRPSACRWTSLHFASIVPAIRLRVYRGLGKRGFDWSRRQAQINYHGQAEDNTGQLRVHLESLARPGLCAPGAPQGGPPP